MLFFPVAAAPVVAGSGPLAPLILGGLGALNGILLLRKLFGGGGGDKPAPTPTNPVTGQPVPLDPTTGQVWGLDTQNGLPHELTQQIWGLEGPAGTQFSGLTPDNFIQQGLPFWAANRFREMSDQLGGWDNLTKWLYDRTNWAAVLDIMRNPWGQSTYDQTPEGVEAQPQANEGQVVETPGGQPPTGGTPTDPTYGTDVYGTPNDPQWAGAAAAAGLGGGIAGSLAGLFGGGGGSDNPTFSTTVYGNPAPPAPQEPLPPGSSNPPFTGGVPGQQPGGPGTPPTGVDAQGNPVYTVTGTSTVPPLTPAPSTYPPFTGGLPPVVTPPAIPITLPNGVPTPNPVPGLTPPPSTGASSGTPTPQVPAGGGAAGGTAIVPPQYPQLPGLPPIASLFGLRPPQAMVPGLSQILGGLR